MARFTGLCMNLNITQKLIVGFLIVIMFSVMVGTFAYVSLSQVAEELLQISDSLDPLVTKEQKVIMKAGKTIISIKRYKISLFIFIMLSFIVTLGVSLFLANKFTDPIISLSKKTELIGQGHLNERIEVNSHDEIGELAKTFNNMASSLQERQRELERANLELEKQDRVLLEANEKLEKLNAVKSDFLSTVSHELRTPLTVIKGYVSLIRNQRLGPINAQQSKGLSAADERADHLNSLISDLLDLSRIESNKFEIRQENLDFCELAEMTINSMKPLFQKKKVHFRSRLPGGLGQVYADRQKISQVLTNLLSNAIKFTPEGGEIILEAMSDVEGEGESQSANPDFIQVNVKDSGIGLDEGETEKIFNKFYQVDNSTTREYGGTGLGLCIAKNIVELHHGQIWAKSRKGEGSIFSFIIPKTQESMHLTRKLPDMMETPPLPCPEVNPERPKEGSGRNILIVEDDSQIRELICTCIGLEHWNVLVAKDGIEAIEKIFQGSIDLVLLDINLPRLNGFDVCQIMKTSEKTKNIPVIILSASAQQSEIDQGFRMGANDYITHPFVPDDVVKRISTLIG
ncbi:MAG: ATP-binding protein [bacterium]